jgi:tetratricopeptide (TPR) repeat protein
MSLRIPASLVLLAFAGPPLAAQTDPLARGTVAMDRWDLSTARRLLEDAVRADPDSYEANWRLAHVLLDIGKETPDSVASPARDSLYASAETYARRAVSANPDGADGHFVLASAIGRASLTRSKREQITRAVEIRNAALRALGLEPEHTGALHVMGRWHAEIRRLSSLQTFFARTFLGADIFDEASWDEAERYLQLAVRHDPERIVHRLDLARVLIDRERWDQAAVQLAAIQRLPTVEPMDVRYRREAARLLRDVVNRQRQ